MRALIHDLHRFGPRAGVASTLGFAIADGEPVQAQEIAVEIGAFIAQCMPGRDAFWTVIEAGRAAGCIAVDGRDASAPRLRWWWLAEPLRGLGLGAALLDRALHRADQDGHRRLDAEVPLRARHAARLLLRQGFDLAGASAAALRLQRLSRAARTAPPIGPGPSPPRRPDSSARPW